MEKQASIFVYYFVYVMDLIVKSMIIIILSPALFIMTILNWYWRKHIKIGDTCFIRSLDNRIIKCTVISVHANKEISVFTERHRSRIIHVNKLNKYSL